MWRDVTWWWSKYETSQSRHCKVTSCSILALFFWEGWGRAIVFVLVSVLVLVLVLFLVSVSVVVSVSVLVFVPVFVSVFVFVQISVFVSVCNATRRNVQCVTLTTCVRVRYSALRRWVTLMHYAGALRWCVTLLVTTCVTVRYSANSLHRVCRQR